MKKKLFTVLATALLFAACTKKNNADAVVVPTPLPDVITPVSASVLASSSAVAIDASTVQQYIRGFGGASILAWIGDLTSDQRVKAFSPTDGIGLSVLRVRIPENTSEFAVEKPTIDAAKSYGANVVATAWSAPVSMKDNANTVCRLCCIFEQLQYRSRRRYSYKPYQRAQHYSYLRINEHDGYRRSQFCSSAGC